MQKIEQNFQKRKGALSITEYRDRGYLSEALLNYISLVGWNPGTDKEIFSKEELIKTFDLAQVHKAGAIFDEIKLQWVNKEHLKNIPIEQFKKEVMKRIPESLSSLDTFESRIDKVMEIIKERISYYGEVEKLITEGELDYYFKDPDYDKSLLIPSSKMLKGKEMNLEDISLILGNVRNILQALGENNWHKDMIREILWQMAVEKGKGAVLWPFRACLSGKEKSADPFTISEIIGKSDTMRRIEHAL